VKVSDGEWKYVEEKQTLYWKYDPSFEGEKPKGWFQSQFAGDQNVVKHWIVISPTPDPKTAVEPKSLSLFETLAKFGQSLYDWVMNALPAKKRISGN
jgi:hypothetical protein